MIVAGVDPGLTGGVAVVGEKGELVAVATALSCGRLDRWLANYEVGHVFLEKAQSMPKQGIASAFNYGTGFGRLLGLLECGGYPVTLVAPHVWTRSVLSGTAVRKDTKGRSLERARQLWPDETWLATPRCKKAHDGMYESALIAYYGHTLLNGGLNGKVP